MRKVHMEILFDYPVDTSKLWLQIFFVHHCSLTNEGRFNKLWFEGCFDDALYIINRLDELTDGLDGGLSMIIQPKGGNKYEYSRGSLTSGSCN